MNWLHIDTWLSTLYQQEGKETLIPQFERTNTNYKLLNHLLYLHLDSTRLVETIINQLRNHAATAATADNNNNNNLSVSGQYALNSMASIAQLLELSTTETSSYYTAISKLSMDQMDLIIQHDELDEIEYKLDTCQREQDDALMNMKNMLNRLQKPKEQPWITGTDQQDVKKKTSEYLTLEKIYHELKIEKRRLRLNNLNELYIKTIQAENELKEKLDHLSFYQVLPSEMILASIKVQETEDQLRELENQREVLLSNIADRML